MTSFIFGLFIITIGVVIIYYSFDLVRWFGKIGWAEEWLGGTRQGYILIGMVVIMLGMMLMFGVLNLGL